MKKIVVVCSILLSLVQLGASQDIKGYLGKRLSIYGDFRSFMRFNPGYKKEDDGSGIKFNTKYVGGIDYVLGKCFSMSLEYETFKTGFETQIPYIDNDYSYYGGSNVQRSSVTLGAKVTGIGVVFNFFNSSKGALAPYGNYNILGIKTLSMSEVDSKDMLGQKFYTNHGQYVIDPEVKVTGLGFTYGFGRKWIYFDRLIFDIRLQMCIVTNKSLRPGVFMKTSSSYGSENYSSLDTKAQIENDMIKRVAGHSLFDFNIGLGLLLF